MILLIVCSFHFILFKKKAKSFTEHTGEKQQTHTLNS
jgi:hypothetical protein